MVGSTPSKIPIIALRRPVSPHCPITSMFGDISENPKVLAMRKGKPHNGYDFAPDPGVNLAYNEIYFCADGVVAHVGDVNMKGEPDGLGNRVSQYVEKPGWQGYIIYGHLKEVPKVKVQQRVFEAQPFANMGKSGNATGIHLHLGVKILPQMLWVPVSDFYYPADPNLDGNRGRV